MKTKTIATLKLDGLDSMPLEQRIKISEWLIRKSKTVLWSILGPTYTARYIGVSRSKRQPKAALAAGGDGH